jgi:hypothetical protein
LICLRLLIKGCEIISLVGGQENELERT